MDAKRNDMKQKIPKILYRKYQNSKHFLQNGLKKTAIHTGHTEKETTEEINDKLVWLRKKTINGR